MAGKETAGFANSDADLYRGASMILTPTPLTDRPSVELVRALMLEIGFGRVVEASPARRSRVGSGSRTQEGSHSDDGALYWIHERDADL